MDLGFGNANQSMGEAVTSSVLKTAKAQEAAIADEMQRYDDLLNSGDDTLEALRERRLAQMKKAQEQKQKWRDLGHGTYQPLGEGQHGGDVAREFFDAAKKSDRMVVHFHRKSTRVCDVFHSHLEKLAPKHLESRFVKIDVEKCSDDAGGGGASFLVEKLGIVVMPTLLVVKNRQAVHHIRGFDELGGTEDFSTEALAYVLGSHGAINRRDNAEPPEELLQQHGGANSMRIKHSSGRRMGARNEPQEFDDE